MSLWMLEVGTHRNAMCPRFAALTADRRRKEQARATVGNEEKKELARMRLDQDHREFVMLAHSKTNVLILLAERLN